MARIPDKYSLSQMPGLRSGRQIASYDATAIGRGISQLAAGIGDIGDAELAILKEEKQQQNSVDIARAEANATKGLLGVQNQFENDPDYSTLNKRGEPEIDKTLNQSAALIRDQQMREKWLAAKQEAGVRAKDWLADQSTNKRRSAEVTALDDANEINYNLIIEPNTPDEIRNKARADIEASIAMNEKTGLITPEEASDRRKLFVQKSYDQQAMLAAEAGKLDLPDPNNPIIGDAIKIDPLTRAMIGVESGGNPGAESNKGASGLMQVMPETAAEIARQLGDTDFPKTLEKQKEYLKNPAVSLRYGQKYMATLLDRYNGDHDAALIAYNGGPSRADAWIKSGRDDSTLPAETADYYKKVKARLPTGDARLNDTIDMPVVTADRKRSPDISNVRPEVVSHFKSLQNALGISIPINSGFRDPANNAAAGGAKKSQHMDGNALDLDVSNMSEAERLKVIRTASALGFTGIGVYANSIHLDLGGRRAWGPSYHKESVPGWAQASISEHMAGKSVPEYWDKVSPGVKADVQKISAARNDEIYREQVTQAKAFQQQSRDDFSLKIAVNPARVSQTDILSNQFLDNGDKAALINTLNSAMKEDTGVNEFISALGTGESVAVNPFDSDQTKIANKAFDKMLSSATEEQRPLITSSVITQTGFIPDKVQAELRRGLASTSVPEMEQALSTADSISRIAPLSIANMTGHDQVEKNLTAFRHFTQDMGYSPEEAARKVINLNDPAMAAQREAVMKSKPVADYLKAVSPQQVADLFDTAFSLQPGLGDTPSQSEISVGYTPESEAVITADYKAMLEEGIADAGGDIELGSKMANERFQKIYGTSGLTMAGDRSVIKLPPEKAYPPDINGSHEYIRLQAIADLKAEGIDATEVFLQPYEQTERDIASRKPANYQLFYVQDGKLNKLPNPFTADPASADKTAIEKSSEIQKGNLAVAVDDEKFYNEIRAARDAASEEFKDYPDVFRMQKMREAEQKVRDQNAN